MKFDYGPLTVYISFKIISDKSSLLSYKRISLSFYTKYSTLNNQLLIDWFLLTTKFIISGGLNLNLY